MAGHSPTTIAIFSADELERHVPAFGALLHACVHGGANVGFVLPYGRAEAEAFWCDGILPALRGGGLVLLVARLEGRIAGTVQLDPAALPNQRHRAEVRKLLVHPDFRGRGIARALMAAIEHEAKRLGRSLLTLDTRTGSDAEFLYRALGFETTGAIPGYCRDPIEDRLDPTTIMYKVL